jgi:hypothetical protein
MDWWGIVLGALLIVGFIGEAWLYHAGLWWHEPKTDRRNWTPPR